MLACQTGPLPDQISPGLSPELEAALPRAADWMLFEYVPENTSPALVSRNLQITDQLVHPCDCFKVAGLSSAAEWSSAMKNNLVQDLGRIPHLQVVTTWSKLLGWTSFRPFGSTITSDWLVPLIFCFIAGGMCLAIVTVLLLTRE